MFTQANLKRLVVLSFLATVTLSEAITIVAQTPPQNGGIKRWSQLWVDPTGQNDLDSDAMCFQDFVLPSDGTITHLEWWGDVLMNHGFQIEFWRQDPGTIAYQPLAVFRDAGARPEAEFVVTNYTTSAHSSGMLHFKWDLPTPVHLAANNAANPRWFLAVIGLTDVPFLVFNWAQGLGASNRSFQWIRGGGNRWYSLPDGRAMLIGGTLAGLHGTVGLSDFEGAIAGQQVTVEFISGGSVVETRTAMLDASGTFDLATPRTGNYVIAVKGSHWLRKMTNAVLPGSSSWTLVNGDSDGDNEVAIGDYAILSAAYNSCVGDPSWDARADLNGDGCADIADYAILSANYGRVGD